MSEIYLTKIERKTIFTKALIFVLIMFIISDLTVTGPFWFNFIPWIYLLGTVGSLKKIDSVLMCVIGTFTVFVASVIMDGGLYFTGIINTVVTLINLVLGVITGKMLYEFVLEHRLVKYIKRSKKIIYIITIVIMFFSSYFMVALNYGNIITYLKSKSNLKKYITNTYNVEDYNIIKTKYNKEVPGKYTYRVNIDGQTVYFVPFTKDIFMDSNRDSRYITAKHNLDVEVGGKAEKILAKYSYLTHAIVLFDIEYNDFEITPDMIVMTIECKAEVQDGQELDELYEDLANCIKELQKVKEAKKITIKINDKSLQLSAKNLEQLNKDYIRGGFEIEELN